MEGIKVCLKCGEEKILEQFPMYSKRNGEKEYRNVCRVCLNIQGRKTSNKNYTPRIKKEITEYKIGRTLYNMLTEEQIKKLEDLANKHDDILKMLSDRLDLWDIEDIKVNRTQKTLMINTELDKIITEHMKKSRLSYSDVANIALKKGLEFIK